MMQSFSRILSVCYLTFAVISLLLVGNTYATNTFEDQKGRFAIDLPDGWELEPQTDETVFVFKGGDNNSIIMQYLYNITDREKLFDEGVKQLKLSGIPNAAPEGRIENLIINDNKARWGLYSGDMNVGSLKIKLYGQLGSVSLNKGGVYLMSIVSEGTLKTLRGTLEKVFHSIRSVEKPVTVEKPHTSKSAATHVTTDTASGSPTVFEHDSLTLTLPEGWVSHEIPANFEREVIGWLKSTEIPGASISVLCYRGWRYNYRNVRIGGLRTVAAAYPAGQKALKNPTKIKTDNGYKAAVELWQGVANTGGQTVLLQSPMVILKTRGCWLLMIGYAPDASGPQLEEDFTKIFMSAN
jgi:hypothetical protein